MDLAWMAWTWQTVAFFGFIAVCLITMMVWEWASPGGSPRHGIFGIDTTRGDRLFISLLSAAYINLGWLGLVGPNLWWAVALSVVWALFVFWKV